MGVKSLHAVSPRFPVQRSSEQGESAPKARQRCVADGKQVNIPAPSYDAMGGRIAEGCPGVGSPGPCIGEGALANPGAEFKDMGRANLFAKQSEVVPRKASKLQSYETVPQTDTGGRDEYSKALERTREKELGKLVP